MPDGHCGLGKRPWPRAPFPPHLHQHDRSWTNQVTFLHYRPSFCLRGKAAMAARPPSCVIFINHHKCLSGKASPGESKEGGAPQWPLSPRRTNGVPNTRRRSWGKILGKGARRHGRFPKPSMLNIQTGMEKDTWKGGAPPWPLPPPRTNNRA